MKSFKAFRLDMANHCLWRNGGRVPIAPKGFDVLAYLVEHAGQVVTQDEILEQLWSGTYRLGSGIRLLTQGQVAAIARSSAIAFSGPVS